MSGRNLPIDHLFYLIQWELNRAAPPPQLLRVPGIGPQTAHNLLRAGLDGKLRDVSDLRRLGVDVSQALPYGLVNGRRPRLPLFGV